MTATSGSVDIDQLVFRLGGVGDVNNIADAFLFMDGARLTDGRSINSSTREVTFTALGIHLNDGQSAYLEVRADTETVVGGGDTANFGLMATDSVSGSATVTGSFPVVGNTMSFSDTATGNLEIEATGSIANSTIGEVGATIGRFRVSANSEDALIHEMTLNIDDAADHSGYELYEGTDLVATGTWLGGDLVRFIFSNPFFLEEGNSRNFKVLADIGGEDGDEIKVAVEERADVVAIGGDFGFNLAIVIVDYDETGGACASSANDCSYSMIEGGELTFAFNGPSTDDVQVDGEDEILFMFTITSQNQSEIKNVGLVIDSNGGNDLHNTTEAFLTDIAIRELDGTVWMGPEELNLGGSTDVQGIDYDQNQFMGPGESLSLMVTADISQNAPVGAEYRVALDMDGTLTAAIDAEDGNGDTLTDIVPSSDLVGNLFTTVESSLSIEKSTPPTSATYVKGTNGVPVIGYSFEAGDASDILVTDLTLNADADTDNVWNDSDNIAVRDHVNSCSLYDNGTGDLIDGPESFDAVNEEAIFSNFAWTVPAGETAKVIVKCNFANVDLEPTGGDLDDLYVFYIDNTGDATGDVTAEDGDGDNVIPAIVSANSNDPVEDTAEIVQTIAPEGNLSVELDGSTPNSTIILGNSLVDMSTFKFDADVEAFNITDLTFVNCEGYNEDLDCTDGAPELSGSDTAVSTVIINYENEAGETVIKSSSISNNRANFANLDFYVPTDETRTVRVTVNTSAVSDTVTESGSVIQLNLVNTGAFNAGAFDAEFDSNGASSGNPLTLFTDSLGGAIDGVAANHMVVRKTKPTISLASSSPSGAGVQGPTEVLHFNVSASGGSISMNQVIFKVAVNDTTNNWSYCDTTVFADETLWEFYDQDEANEKLDDNGGDWTFYDAAGVVCSNQTSPIAYAVLDLGAVTTHGDEDISKDEGAKTYVLKVDTLGAVSDDSIRIDILDQATLDVAPGALTGLAAFEWDDDDLTAASSLGINGDLLKNLPVTGGSIIY